MEAWIWRPSTSYTRQTPQESRMNSNPIGFATQSIEGWDVMMWHLTPVGRMPEKDPHLRREGSNKGRDVQDEGPLSSHACLSLFFSSLNLICLLVYSLLLSIDRDLSIYRWFSWPNKRRTLYSNLIWIGPILMDSYMRYNCHHL